MPLYRLNHAVLFVRDVDTTVGFYTEVLGFRYLAGFTRRTNAAFLRAPGSNNDHDLAVFAIGRSAGDSAAGRSSVGMYHLGWEVDTLAELEQAMLSLARAGALAGATDHSTTKSVYGQDPDGLEFEILWLVPADLLDDEAVSGRLTNRPLDIEKEKRRYGADTLGGVGISRPALNAGR
jgi:catechol-2,3-dioxygenase